MADHEPWGYELTILCAMAFRTAVDELHKKLNRIGFDDVRPSHGFLFEKLTPNGATGMEIAEHLGITKQAASVMIDDLAKKGYVERRPHPSDRRGKLIVLTERGWDCINAVETIFTAIEERWEQVLGKDKIVSLRLDLRKLVYSSGNSESIPLRPVW